MVETITPPPIEVTEIPRCLFCAELATGRIVTNQTTKEGIDLCGTNNHSGYEGEQLTPYKVV